MGGLTRRDLGATGVAAAALAGGARAATLADSLDALDAAVAMDLRLALMEFDVSERGTPAAIPERDRQIAELAGRYLDFMFAYRKVDYLMDHYCWLQNFGSKRPDGMLKRPTLYDDEYQPKPLRQAIADAFRDAPMRA